MGWAYAGMVGRGAVRDLGRYEPPAGVGDALRRPSEGGGPIERFPPGRRVSGAECGGLLKLEEAPPAKSGVDRRRTAGAVVHLHWLSYSRQGCGCLHEVGRWRQFL